MRTKTATGKLLWLISSEVTFVLTGILLVSGGTARAQAPLGPAKSDSPVTLENQAAFLLLDFTKKDDKTSPVLRLGYQSPLGDAIRRMRALNPESDIHHVPYYSVNLTGVPSGDTAHIFSGGQLSTSGDVQVSFGEAYLASWVTPRDLSLASTLVKILSVAADTIETEKSKSQPDQMKLDSAKQAAEEMKASLAQKQKQAKVTAFKLLFQADIDYAKEVIKYAEPDAIVKPTAPDSNDVVTRRRGPIYDAWFARLGFTAGSTTLFDSSKPFGNQFQDKNYNGYSAQMGYSSRWGGSFPVIVGLSGGVARSSNVDQLKSTDVTETQTLTSPDGTTKRVISTKRTGLVGDFKERTGGLGKIDIVLYPGLAAASRDGKNPRSTIALDVFGRAQEGERFIFGLGTYVTKPGSPTSVYGGLNIYRAASKKLAIDLVAGFPF
jgi:hypothetical protein